MPAAGYEALVVDGPLAGQVARSPTTHLSYWIGDVPSKRVRGCYFLVKLKAGPLTLAAWSLKAEPDRAGLVEFDNWSAAAVDALAEFIRASGNHPPERRKIILLGDEHGPAI